ncbi:MAG: phosphoribosylglycinamide formyltransferase [Campylobacterota bacterium]|nr:phosphoribosylglycinamide formyltransferase [Campylobacterota bacterium]
MKKIVILFSGEGSNLLNLIQTMHQKECFITAAITNRPKAGGIERARAHNIPVEVIDHTLYESREAFDTELIKTINSYEPELVVMAGFMRILSPVFFRANYKAINIHPSLLPLFKGTRAIEKSFESSESYGGISVHWVTEELDSGQVIAQDSFAKNNDETLESFTAKIRSLEHSLLPATIIKLLKKNK